MNAWRIADSRHPIFDPTGAAIYGGRWNSPGRRVIYASESYAQAMLEVLAHRNKMKLPKHHKSVLIHIPASLPVETVLPSALPGWDAEDESAAKAFGDRWYDELRTPVLRVPSAVTHGPEFNLVLNANHPDFSQITADPPAPVLWDLRLEPSAVSALRVPRS